MRSAMKLPPGFGALLAMSFGAAAIGVFRNGLPLWMGLVVAVGITAVITAVWYLLLLLPFFRQHVARSDDGGG